MWRRRLKEEAAAAAAAAAAAEKRRKQEVAGSSPGEVICFQILTSQMGSPAPVGGAGALPLFVIPGSGPQSPGVPPARYAGLRIRALGGCVSRVPGASERLFQAESSFEPEWN